MKRILICATLTSTLLLLNACSFSDIEIEKISKEEPVYESNAVVSTSDNSGTSAPDSLVQEEAKQDYPIYVGLGESFFAENLILPFGNGVINATINKAEVFQNLKDAGIELEETFPYSVEDGVNYDTESDIFLNNRVLVKLYFTIENVNATSPEHADEPERYNEYDFRVDGLGGCTEGPIVYFNKHDEHDSSYYTFHLEPGETTELEVAYLVHLGEIALDSVQFVTAYPYEDGTIVDLNLE